MTVEKLLIKYIMKSGINSVLSNMRPISYKLGKDFNFSINKFLSKLTSKMYVY